MSKRIAITVDQDGNSTIDAEGFTGKECIYASDLFVPVLGEKSTVDLKDEAYSEAETVTEGQETVLESY